MPLPQKVIEQLGREPPRTQGWSGQLLMFSSVIFFLCLLIYFGLAYGYKAYLSANLKKIQDKQQQLVEEVPAEEQARLASFYSQVANLQSLLSAHIYSSKLFDWLEKNTQANVYFSRFNLNVSSNQLTMEAAGKTMGDVNQQLAVFEASPEVRKMNVTNIAPDLGLWRFTLSLSLEPGFYNSSAMPQQH